MSRLLLCFCAAMATAAVVGQITCADQIVAQFDENVIPTNPQNGFGSFTFGDITGAVTDGPDSLIFDVMTDNDGSNGFFGGIGVDYGIFTEIIPTVFVLLPLDFDPALSWWEMRVKKLPNNVAATVNTVYRDVDILGQTAEEYQFNFNLAGIPSDDNFHIITVQATNFGFMQNSQGIGDGGNNPGLNQIQIQSVFGSSDRLNIEVDWVRIVTSVPEPSAMALLGLGCMGLIATSRRRLA